MRESKARTMDSPRGGVYKQLRQPQAIVSEPVGSTSKTQTEVWSWSSHCFDSFPIRRIRYLVIMLRSIAGRIFLDNRLQQANHEGVVFRRTYFLQQLCSSLYSQC